MGEELLLLDGRAVRSMFWRVLDVKEYHAQQLPLADSLRVSVLKKSGNPRA